MPMAVFMSVRSGITNATDKGPSLKEDLAIIKVNAKRSVCNTGQVVIKIITGAYNNKGVCYGKQHDYIRNICINSSD
jgi:hypothetical protein